MRRYKFVFEWLGGKVTAYKTQSEIAEMLKNPDIKLISIDDCEVFKLQKKKGNSYDSKRISFRSSDASNHD